MLISVYLLPNHAHSELHDVLGERSGLVREDVPDLPQLLVESSCIYLARLEFAISLSRAHLYVNGKKPCLSHLDKFNCNK